jgi:hypothetical protein
MTLGHHLKAHLSEGHEADAVLITGSLHSLERFTGQPARLVETSSQRQCW